MGVGWWVVSGSGKGVQSAKPGGLVISGNQNQTLLSIRTSAAVFISVIVHPPTLQFTWLNLCVKYM